MDTSLLSYAQQNDGCPQGTTSWYCDKDWTGECFPVSTYGVGESMNSITNTPYTMAICQDDKGCNVTVCANVDTTDNCKSESVKKGGAVVAFGNCGPIDQISGKSPGPFLSSTSQMEGYQCVIDYNLPTVVTNAKAGLTSYYVCDANGCTQTKGSPADFVSHCNNTKPKPPSPKPPSPDTPTIPTIYCPDTNDCTNSSSKQYKQDVTGLSIGLSVVGALLILFIILYAVTKRKNMHK